MSARLPAQDQHAILDTLLHDPEVERIWRTSAIGHAMMRSLVSDFLPVYLTGLIAHADSVEVRNAEELLRLSRQPPPPIRVDPYSTSDGWPYS